MKTIEDAFDKTRARIRLGGFGDIVSTIPTAHFLEAHGVDVIPGGVAWEWVVVDPQPSPRHFDEIENI